MGIEAAQSGGKYMGIEAAQSGGKCGCCGQHYHAGDQIEVWRMAAHKERTGKKPRHCVAVMRCPHCPKNENARLPGLPGDWAPIRAGGAGT